MITQQQAVDIALSIVEEMRMEWVPNYKTRYKKGGSTGNMAFMALLYKLENGILTIYIDENIAPYVPYTNEAWLSSKWHGKQNPNQGWWDRFVAEFTRRFANRLKGVIR